MTGLRIAILGSRGYPSTYGGFETLVRYLAPYLRDRGAEVTVYGRERPSGRSDRQQIRVIDTPGLSTKSLSTLSHGLAAAMHAATQSYDAVVVLNIAHGFFLPLIKCRRSITLLNVDGMEWEREKWNGTARTVFRLGGAVSARWADELIADSREISRRWAQIYGRTLTFIPYGADTPSEIGCSTLGSVGLGTDGYHLMVARLVPENNISTFLHAATLSRSTRRFVLVGSGDLHPSARDLLRTLTASGRVLALGHVSDQQLLTELWANARSYFHGHSAGGTNPALLQAMSYGAPVIAQDSPYSREVLGDLGRYVTNADELVTAWEELDSAEPAMLEAERQSTRTIILERYTWPSVCASYAELIVDGVRGDNPRLGRQRPGCTPQGPSSW